MKQKILDFDAAGGLLPAIAQDYQTGDVLMLAWMNRDAWQATQDEGIAVYWSRSRKRLWRKGESSGNTQVVREIFIDCDRDAILLKVEQKGGAACHTGRPSCFFNKVVNGKTVVISEPLFNPEDVYPET